MNQIQDLDPATTALIIVDLQQGIVELPLTPYPSDQVIARSVELGRALASVGGTIVLVNTSYSDGYADRLNHAADAPMSLPPEGLPESWATLVPEVAALPARGISPSASRAPSTAQNSICSFGAVASPPWCFPGSPRTLALKRLRVMLRIITMLS